MVDYVGVLLVFPTSVRLCLTGDKVKSFFFFYVFATSTCKSQTKAKRLSEINSAGRVFGPGS